MSNNQGDKIDHIASVGILMLQTQFPRILGDAGNPATWPFDVQYRVVAGATPDAVICNGGARLTRQFIEAAKDLIDAGVDGITTTCGFLSLIQDQLSAAVGVPVATSSLMQVSMVQALLPMGKRVGIITIAKNNLTKAHLTAANVPLDTPIIGTEAEREFNRSILEDREKVDFAACRLDLLDAARQLQTGHENIGAIVLECTNMAPYAADIQKLTGLPIYSIYTFINWFQSGLVPRKFQA